MAVTEPATPADVVAAPDQQLVAGAIGQPSVVVDDLHVTYRVYGGRKTAVDEARGGWLRRMAVSGARQVGGITDVPAVRGMTFVVHHGESIGVVGRNGSGKSSLLRAIAGLIPPTKGAVYIAGQTSLLGVNAVLMSELSGERNILIGGLALGLTMEQVRERFDDVVDFAGIREFVHLPMKTYSSGMGARLRFAISSAARPDVLLIDEALATGDAEFQAKSKERIDRIRHESGTIFLVSHSLASVRRMCTRALWIEQGTLKMDGPVDDVCTAYQAAVTGPGERAR
jgi:teichoic acid transport system ATP-binding protein